MAEERNCGSSRQLQQIENVGVPTMVPCFTKTENDIEIDTELAQVVEAWPALPQPLKQGILAMIQAADSGEESVR